MLDYFIGFTIVGFFLGFIEESISFLVVLAITVLWFFGHGFWAIATFLELLLGMGIAQALKGDDL